MKQKSKWKVKRYNKHAWAVVTRGFIPTTPGHMGRGTLQLPLHETKQLARIACAWKNMRGFRT